MANPGLGQTTVSAAAIGAATYTTTGINTSATGSSFLLTVVQINSSTPPTFSLETYGNTYSLVSFGSGSNPGQEPSNLQWCFFYVCLGGVGGAGHSIKVTSGSGNLLFVEFTEITATNLIDVSASATHVSGAGSSPLSNPVTTTVANDLVYGIGFSGASVNCTAGAGFTQNSNVGVAQGGFGSCYLAAASVGSNDPDMSKGGNAGGFVVATLAFNPAALAGNVIAWLT